VKERLKSFSVVIKNFKEAGLRGGIVRPEAKGRRASHTGGSPRRDGAAPTNGKKHGKEGKKEG